MGKKEIGSALRDARLAAKYKIPDVSELLMQKGVRASKKTVYSWEQGRSQPGPDTLLMLCELYGIEDVLLAFGYKRNRPPKNVLPGKEGGAPLMLELSESEAALIEAYRRADGDTKTIVKTALRRFLPPHVKPLEETQPPARSAEELTAEWPAGIAKQPAARYAGENEPFADSAISISIAARGGGVETREVSKEQVDTALSELQKLAPYEQDL